MVPDELHEPRQGITSALVRQNPESVLELIINMALEQPELDIPGTLPGILLIRMRTLSRSPVIYRILKAHDLVTSPQFIVMSAADAIEHLTRRVHELRARPVLLSYFRVTGLACVLAVDVPG